MYEDVLVHPPTPHAVSRHTSTNPRRTTITKNQKPKKYHRHPSSRCSRLERDTRSSTPTRHQRSQGRREAAQEHRPVYASTHRPTETPNRQPPAAGGTKAASVTSHASLGEQRRASARRLRCRSEHHPQPRPHMSESHLRLSTTNDRQTRHTTGRGPCKPVNLASKEIRRRSSRLTNAVLPRGELHRRPS